MVLVIEMYKVLVMEEQLQMCVTVLLLYHDYVIIGALIIVFCPHPVF